MNNQDYYILYIEDEYSMVDLVSRALKSSGYQVTSATSGRQGLAMIHKRKPDLVLLDLMMPGVNGWDVYREMKSNANLTHIPVIALSARPLEKTGIIINELPPVDDYFVKPLDMEALIHSMQRLL
jgi:DNA-binding response OmpR family regulator